MKTKVFLSALLLITAILTTLMSCSSEDPRPIEQRLQETLDRRIRKYGARGASAAVIFADGNIWTGVSGISHEAVMIEPDMLFAIGSITKNVVAALALQLHEEGTLSLNDPLSKWLPVYRHVDSTITIRQLLNHTSGLYMFWDNETIWDDLKKDRTRVWTPEEVLSYIKEPYFPPGRGFRYSNTNYLLLAMIIEEATGSSLAAEFRTRFWQPLGIENAWLSMQEVIPDNQAHVYGDNFNHGDSDRDLTFLPRASHESITYGSSGLFITAEDLARWCHALFEGEVLSPPALDDMLQFVKFRSFANMRAYGLGVQVFKRSLSHGKQAIGHGGGNIGTTTYMVYLPEYHVSVVVMINAFPNKCAGVITKDLITTVLREYKAIGVLPYVDFFPLGFVLLCATICMISVTIVQMRRRRK